MDDVTPILLVALVALVAALVIPRLGVTIDELIEALW